MSWTPRTTAPAYGTPPYDWNAFTRGQCTWYAYWRVQEEGYSPPCWQTGSGSSGSGAYNHAATWLDHYRDPWQVKSTSYTPVPGDLAVFSTADPAGHVAVIESIVDSTTAMISDYNIRLDESFWYRSWTIGGGIGSTGVLIGYLHYPSSGPTPPPTPSETLTIDIYPSSYSVTMQSSEDYVDFPFTITVSGIPAGGTVSGGNSYPGLARVYNSGWSYTDYTVSGVTYRSATKSQTLRYQRESGGAYTTVKHMYYNLSFSTGSVSTDTPMYINVEAKLSARILAALVHRRRKGGIFDVTRI